MIDGVGRGNGLKNIQFQAANKPASVAPGAVRRNEPAPAAFGAVVRELAASPPVDAARVETLKARFQAGQLTPDPRAIAAAMLRLER